MANKFYERLKRRNPEKRTHTLVQTLVKPAVKYVEEEIQTFKPDVIFVRTPMQEPL